MNPLLESVNHNIHSRGLDNIGLKLEYHLNLISPLVTCIIQKTIFNRVQAN